MMGSAHTYDVAGAKKLTAEGIEVGLVIQLQYTLVRQ